MPPLWNAFTLSTLAFTTLATPHHSLALQPRDNPSATPLTPGFEAKITSPTGDDVTSNFQILLYESPPQQGAEAVSNLTDRQAPLVRLLNFCRTSNQIFSHSKCNYRYRSGHGSPFQQYIVWCRDNRPAPTDTNGRLISQLGACNADELCVDGAGATKHGDHGTVAKCVARSLFKPLLEKERTEDEKRRLAANLPARTAAVTLLTQTDGTTPLNAERLEVDAGVAEDGVVQSNRTCTDCFHLATPKFGEGTDFLKTQATLSAAGAVTAGIMFLAVLSG